MALGKWSARWVPVLVAACCAVAVSAAALADPEGWSDDTRLTWTEPLARTSYANANSVVCDIFGNVHVVWTEEADYYYNAYYVCRAAGQASWTTPLCLSDWMDASFYPAMACDSLGNVHVVWCNYCGAGPDIYYRKYDGASWSSIQRLTDDSYESWNPSIAVDEGGRVHVAWFDLRDGNEEIYYKQFDGTAWGPDQRLTSEAHISWYPAIAADSKGAIHVVWGDFRRLWRIWYKRLDATGWSPDTMLTTPSADHPAIAIGGDDTIHLVWVDQRDDDHEIYYKEHDGSGWSADVRLTASAGYSYNPSVAVDADGNVHVTWYDTCDGDQEIYYRVREGGLWSPVERLTNSSGWSQFPAIGTDQRGGAHVAWMDMRDGNYELYYKERCAPAAGLPTLNGPIRAACLLRASPNPAQSEVRLDFWLASASPTRLVVADVSGRVLWHESAAVTAPGWHSVTWACRSGDGLPVAPGIYLARIEAGTGVSRAKLVLVR